MVKAVITLEDREDRVLNVVKGKYGLKNKSEAVSFVIHEFEQELLEPELRPEYIEKIKRTRKEKTVKIGTAEDFKKLYGLK